MDVPDIPPFLITGIKQDIWPDIRYMKRFQVQYTAFNEFLVTGIRFNLHISELLDESILCAGFKLTVYLLNV